MKIEGKIVDIHNSEIFEGSIEVLNGRIVAINRHANCCDNYLMPGFIDAHVHTESSMLTPAAFGHMVISKGTVAIVSDPHEIANVAGVKGVEFMLKNNESSPIKCFFTIPSSVPATGFDIAGGEINSEDVEKLAKTGKFVALSEMMNVFGVISKDEEVIKKIEIAKKYNLVIDGHAPMVSGEDLRAYINSGISTDHECSNQQEAQEKINNGMKILIREGSAAKNYLSLKSLIATNPEMVMFCTDDSHPEDILDRGHIDKLVRRAVADGFDVFSVLKIASLNAVEHYKLDVGLLREGDKADFIVVDNLKDFNVQSVYIDGEKYDATTKKAIEVECFNNFNHQPITISQLKKKVENTISVIGVIKNELLTSHEYYSVKSPVENLESDIEQDINKIVYINRYNDLVPVVEFCKGFGLKKGAIASSISHDSHNIVAVGANDEDLLLAINQVIAHKGALVIVNDGEVSSLPLPIGGILSDKNAQEVSEIYLDLHAKAEQMGVKDVSPFMLLSFMALIVIPEIKIGEKGLFSFSKFNWI